MGKKASPSRPTSGRSQSSSSTASPRDRTIQELTPLFKSLADEHRLKILFLLAERGEMHVSSISEELEQSQPAISHHLLQLRNAGLIGFRRDGKFNYYTLSPDGLGIVYQTLVPDGAPFKQLIGGVEISLRWKG